MGLVLGWLQANTSARAAWGPAEAAAAESRKEASEALGAHEAVLASAASAKERCDKAEGELTVLQEGQAARAQ